MVCRVAIAVAIALCAAMAAHADTQSATGDATNSDPFAAVAASPEANLFSGTMSMSIPIEVPPGRKGATPSLALAYSSAGGDGPFGLGWSVPTGSISRSTKWGVPNCTGAHVNDFVLEIAGASNELVVKTAGVYVMKRDEAWLEATPDTNANTWTVRERSGRTFRFGTVAALTDPNLPSSAVAARLYRGTDTFLDSASCALTSIWALTQIEEPNGNLIDFKYHLDSGSLYPLEVLYGKNVSVGGSDHVFRIRFTTELRTNPTLSFRSGVREELRLRVSAIETGAGASFSAVRSYTLSYSGCANLLSTLLCSVSTTGSGGSALPTQTFEYSSDDFKHGGAGATASWDPPGQSEIRISDTTFDIRRTLMDMNGDGVSDFVQPELAAGDPWSVRYGSAAGMGGASIFGVDSNSTVPPSEVEKVDLRGGNSVTHLGLADVTGDGVPDYIDTDVEGTGQWRVYPGICDSRFVCRFKGAGNKLVFSGTDGNEMRKDDIGAGYSTLHDSLMDFNADGLADLLTPRPANTYCSLPEPEVPGGCAEWTTNPGNFQVRKNNGNGTGFYQDSQFQSWYWGPISYTVPEQPGGGGKKYTHIAIFDFNGDGLPDLVTNYWKVSGTDTGLNSLPGGLRVYLNNGFAFETNPIELPTLPNREEVRSSDTNQEALADWADMNSDGRPDRVNYYPSGQNGTVHWVQLNTGTGLASAIAWDGPSGPWRLSTQKGNTLIDLADWNGDGLLDRISSTTGMWEIQLGRPKTGPWIRPNLLVKAHNGLGGVSEIAYAPSSAYYHADPVGPVVGPPFLSWLVDGTRRTDGLCEPGVAGAALFDPALNPCIDTGHELVRTLSYEGGKFDAAEREFRGFAKVTELAGDGTQRIVEFHQDSARAGKVLSEETKAGAYRVRRVDYTWLTQADGSRTQVYLREKKQRTYATPGGAENNTADSCVVDWNEPPDLFGRVSQSCSMSCATAGVATSCTSSTPGILSSTTVWTDPASGTLRERPWRVTAKFTTGAPVPELVSYQQFWYDDRTDALVTKGNVTRTVKQAEETADASRDPEITHTYDGYGNLMTTAVTQTGGPPRVTTSDFGPAPYALYAAIDTAPSTGGVVHQTSRVADIAIGKETSVTDENGATATFTYDSLGRRTCEAAPGDSCGGTGFGDASARTAFFLPPGVGGSYQDRLSFVEAKTQEPASPSGYLVSRVYLDALGRKRFTTVERVVGSTTSLSTVVVDQTEYDAAGRVRAILPPYVATGSVAAPADNNQDLRPDGPHRFFTYNLNGLGVSDPLGRLRSKTGYDGRTTTFTYKGLTVETVDNGNHLTRLVSDAFGRETLKQLHEGTSSLQLWFNYGYDGAGRLTSTTVGSDARTTQTVSYDLLGRKRSQLDPSSGAGGSPGLWQYKYDRNSSLIYQDDPTPNQHVEMCYDELGRITRRLVYTSSDTQSGLHCTTAAIDLPAGVTLESSFVYDGGSFGKGRLGSVSDLAGSETYTYNALGLVVDTTRSIASGQSFSAPMSFTYDEANRAQTITYPDGQLVTNGYLADGQPASLSGYVTDLDYDVFGRATRIVCTQTARSTSTGSTGPTRTTPCGRSTRSIRRAMRFSISTTATALLARARSRASPTTGPTRPSSSRTSATCTTASGG